MKKVIWCTVLLSLIISITAVASADGEGSWGSWSQWQDEPVNGSSTRQVETRQVIDSYTMETWVYGDSSSPSQRGYWAYFAGNEYLRIHHEDTWPKEWVDAAKKLSDGEYHDWWDGTGADGRVHGATAYVYGLRSAVPFFITGTNYKTQFRYRDFIKENPVVKKKHVKTLLSKIKVSNCIYTGWHVKPKVSLVFGKTKLKEGVDYIITYKNNKRVGKATIIITGCGKYCGTVKRTFKINPKSTTLKKCISGKKQIKVRWKILSKNCSGYQIRYSTKKNFKSCEIKTIKGKKKTTCMLKKLKAGTKYYIQIRVWCKVGTKKYFSCWSKTKVFKTKSKRPSTTIYHYREKGIYRYELQPVREKSAIKGDKLIVRGKMKITDDPFGRENRREDGKRNQVPIKGKKHVFKLTSKTNYWWGDGKLSKKEFKNSMGYSKGTWMIIDTKNGKVESVGFVGIGKEF